MKVYVVQEGVESGVLNLVERLITSNNPFRKDAFELFLIPGYL